jgi:cysteine desulfurase family protein (TIGR01976 family)
MTFDIARVRERYPALAEGFAHFDAAAGSLVAVGSSDAISAVTRGAVANKTMAFAPGRRAYGIVEEARAAVADLVGGASAGVVFGPSATALTYLVARTLGDTWRPGDEIVVSRLDHDANVRPWVQVAGRVGATVRWAEVDTDTGVLATEQYKELVTERTRLVALTAASNAIGARPDVAAIAAIAHAAGALTYVDGVHATPHAPIDVAALGADFYVTSAYKWSGPHIAACVASPDRWAAMAPDKLIPSPDEVPDRFEFGTLSFELLAGVTGAVDHLASLAVPLAAAGTRRSRLIDSMTAVQAYEMELFAALADGLKAIDGVQIRPAPSDRCPTIAFRLAGQHPSKTADLLGEEGICVYSGDYYAYEYFTAAGLRDSGGAVRAGIYHYTTREEVDRLLDAVMRCR